MQSHAVRLGVHEGFDDLIIGVHPHHVGYYSRMWGMEVIGDEKSYSLVSDKPVVLLSLRLDALATNPSRGVRHALSLDLDGATFDRRCRLAANVVGRSVIGDDQAMQLGVQASVTPDVQRAETSGASVMESHVDHSLQADAAVMRDVVVVAEHVTDQTAGHPRASPAAHHRLRLVFDGCDEALPGVETPSRVWHHQYQRQKTIDAMRDGWRRMIYSLTDRWRKAA